MFILNWYRQYLELKREFSQEKICESCETLKQMNDHLRMDNEKLLRRILEKPEPEIQTPVEPQITRPKTLPWRVKQQMLEQEDRARARALRNAPKEDVKTDELEKELGIAEQSREAEAASQS